MSRWNQITWSQSRNYFWHDNQQIEMFLFQINVTEQFNVSVKIFSEISDFDEGRETRVPTLTEQGRYVLKNIVGWFYPWHSYCPDQKSTAVISMVAWAQEQGVTLKFPINSLTEKTQLFSNFLSVNVNFGKIQRQVKCHDSLSRTINFLTISKDYFWFSRFHINSTHFWHYLFDTLFISHKL